MDTEYKEQTVLHLACRNGETDCVSRILQIALDLGIAKELICQHGFLDMTALHWAAENGHADIATKLLQTAIDLGIGHKVIHAYGFCYRTPLWYAISNNRTRLIPFLQAAEANHPK